MITFTPAADFNGAAEIAYTVTDQHGASAAATVTVAVAAVNDAPVLTGALADARVPASGGAIPLDGLALRDVDGAPRLEVRLAGGDPPLGIVIAGGALIVPEGVAPGSYALEIFASDGDLESDSVAFTLTVDAPEAEAFAPVAIQGEALSPIPDGDTSAANDTLIRTQTQNQERAGLNNPAGPANPGMPEFDAFGLRPGYTGAGYLDINGAATGVRAVFQLEAPAGEYQIHIRLANGGAGSATDRPIGVAVDGVQQGVSQATNTGGFGVWQIRSFAVTLTGDGPHTIGIVQATASQAPNIDAIAVTAPGAEPSFFAPVITSAAAVSVTEGQTAVLGIAATDADANTLRYSLTGDGADSALFAIDAATGTLRFAAAPDFEAPDDRDGDNVYQVEVAVSDGWSTTAQSISVTVTDDAGDDPSGNITPAIVSGPAFTLAEGETAVGAVEAIDPDGGALSYSLTGADADRLSIDQTGALTLAPSADFETPSDADADGAFSATVVVSDGAATVTQDITVTISDRNEAPGAINLTGALTFAQDAAAGTVLGAVASVDPDAGDAGDAVSFTVSDPRFAVNAAGELVIAAGAAFDTAAQPSIGVTLTATDAGGLSTARSFSFAVTAAAAPAGPVAVLFDSATLGSYSSQDVGSGASVADDGATLSLNGNLWKRAPLTESYKITANTKITATVTLGEFLSEIIAIGFDEDNQPFNPVQRSVYQIAGSEGQGAFVDLRGGANGAPGQSIEVTIDLSAHAGKTIASLVFVADDDVRTDGTGSARFSAVRLVEQTDAAGGNAAPVVVGGGIADFVVPEGGAVEIDLPFLDRDGDALSYALRAVDAAGNPAAAFEGLTFAGETLAGVLGAAPDGAPYTLTITARDGRGGEVSTSFALTVTDVNEAPVAHMENAFEPFTGKLGQPIAPIDLSLFADAFSDPDGDPLILTAEGLPPGLRVNAEGVIIGTPTGVGAGAIRIVATDPAGLRAELSLPLLIETPAIGDVTVLEAESFTGLAEATAFFATGSSGASGNQIIRTKNGETGSVSTALAQNGLLEGWYAVSVTLYDETDGSSVFSLRIGDTLLADALAIDTGGAFDNPGRPRGASNQPGNVKSFDFPTLVHVDADTIATLSGVADGGETLRIDRLTFTRAAQPALPPSEIALDGGVVAENAEAAVIGRLQATDPDGDAAALVYTADDARFTVDGDILRLADGISLDHEAAAATTVAVTVTDAQGLSRTTELAIAVADVNEAPGFAPGAAQEDVMLVSGTGLTIDLATALGATDPDAGDTVVYAATLSDGAALPQQIVLDGGILAIGADLPAGGYEIAVLASDGTLGSDPVRFMVRVAEAGAFQPIVIQAEDASAVTIALAATANGNATVTAIRDAENPEVGGFSGLRPDFSGSGYLDFGDDAGDQANFTVLVDQAGAYDINIRYGSQDAAGGPRAVDIAINGAPAATTTFPSTGPSNGPAALQGFNVWGFLTQTVTLQAGVNVIALAIPAGASAGPNIDRIEITAAGSGPIGLDLSADADGAPLFLSGPDGPLNPTQAASINFNIAGRDADIVTVEVSFDNGVTRVLVLPDADGDFTVDGSALAPGAQTATVHVTDAAGNEAQTSMAFVVGQAAQPAAPFSIEIQAESFAIADLEPVSGAPADTLPRNAAAPEAGANAGNSGPGRTFDASGLRPGYEGAGYLDMGNDIGDTASFTIDAPSDGVYQLTVRYANGGAADRPMTIVVGGVAQTVAFGSTIPAGGTSDAGWANWTEITVDIDLSAGGNTVSFVNRIANGPNIDRVTVRSDTAVDPGDPRAQIRFEEVAKINFEPAPTQTTQGLPAG